MAVSKAQQRATNKYKKSNYDRLELVVPKGQKDTIKAHASALGESVNGFIGRAISEAMERDSSGNPAIGPSEALQATPGAGVVSLSPDALEAAQRAAEAAGEATPQFIARAIDTQAKRDALGRKMEGGNLNERT